MVKKLGFKFGFVSFVEGLLGTGHFTTDRCFGQTGVWSLKNTKDVSTNKAEIYKDMWGSLQEHLLKNASCSSLTKEW